MSDFSGKVAIVTGSSSGLGEAIALLLAQRGASVTLCGRNEQRLQDVLQKCVEASGGHPERFLIVAGDMKEKNVRRLAVDKTIETFGRLDVLVPNAGQAMLGMSIDTASDESFKHYSDIMLKSVVFLIQYSLQHLEKTKGSIVSISSMNGSYPQKSTVVYNMMKAAVNHMTRCLSVDLGHKGIRVNAILPGVVPTRLTDGFSVTEEHYRFAAQSSVLGRNGTPEDIAEATVFLASSAASYITGQCLLVSGGKEFTGCTLWTPDRA